MPRKRDKIVSIDFDAPATVDEALEALTELRETHGGAALVRARAFRISASANGAYVGRITAEANHD